MNSAYRYRVFTLLWALLILGLCAIPGQHLPSLTFLNWMRPDKIVHLFLFGVLAFLLLRSFQLQANPFSVFQQFPNLSSFVISSVYGIVIELLQEYVFINRTGEVYDAVADSAGALLGLWIANYLAKRKIVGKEI